MAATGRHGVEIPAGSPAAPGWASDVAAQMMRTVGIEYVALNPGASYRGLHDSLVNHLGNRAPQMLLCLNEDHVVSIAHGYAKASDRMMGCVLHSNVGLMHGLMGIFNAWCDRMPMLVVGATGPVATEKRRPWIDWIHTAKDQGALLRNYTKWDDEPRSVPAIVEGFLRAAQMTMTHPRAPTYICLDAGLQEQSLAEPARIPAPGRYAPAPPPSASREQVDRVVELLGRSERPLLLVGRVSRSAAGWDRRVRLAEKLGARVLTSIRERCAFPTDHPLHAAPPIQWLSPDAKAVVAEADLVISLDWPELNGTLLQLGDDTAGWAAPIVHVSLDSILHNGWSMDHFSLPPVDVPIQASPDVFVDQLFEALAVGEDEPLASTPARAAPAYSDQASTELAPRDIEVALARLRGDRKITLAHVTIGWAGDAYHFRDPLDFLGHDGGGGLAAGPGLTIGAALALRGSGRIVVSVLGDGDYIQGVTALWTAAHYAIPALFVVSNNRSNFNDEIHQEAVAKMRGRPPENRWIGQRIDGPEVDLCGLARAQGVRAGEPVVDVASLEAELERGLQIVAGGASYLIDVRVKPGYANPPLSRGKG